MKRTPDNPLAVYAVAGVATAAAVVIRWLLDPVMGDSLPLATLFGAVAVTVWFGGYRPALLVLVVGYVVFDYLFIDPRGRLALDKVENLVGLLVYVFTCSVIIWIGEAMRAAQREIAQQKEQWRTTLASVGDAVISTDADGNIAYLNPVAESLTGWTNDEARGQPLNAVFHIVSEETRRPVDNPALRALKEGIIVGLANHTILISKNGSERPIDDSAAPIRSGSGQVVGCVLVFRDISDRKQAENATLRAEEKLHTIIDTVPALIAYIDSDARYIHNNRAYERWFGHSREEITGRHMRDVLGEDAWSVISQKFEAALTGQTVHYEAQVPYKDAGLRWIDATYVPDFGADGKVAGVVALVNDVTDRKQAENERLRLASIVENSFDYIAISDAEGKPLYVNPAGRKLIGLDPDQDVSRTTILEYFTLEDRAFLKDAVLPASSRDGRWSGELTFRHWKTGAAIPVFCELFRVDDPATGKPINFATVIRDLTERKRQEQEWEASQKTIATLIERCPFGIYIVDADFRIANINARSEDGAFANVRPLIGRPFDEAIRILWPEPVAAEVIQKFRHTLDTGEPYYSVVFVNPRADIGQTEGYEWELHRISLPDGRHGVVCYYYDSTKLRQAEQALREADRRKDEFLATLAHELRNPLAPLRNGLQVMRLSKGDAETVEQSRAMMERQLDQMVRLVDDLLDVSRISRGKLKLKKECVPLAAVIHSAVETSRPLIEQMGHALVVALSECSEVVVNADLTRLAQVFVNLLNNAAKYGEAGGRIWLTAERQGSDVVVTIKDSGIGIAADQLPRIFEMFSQVDRSLERSQSGLGIGLTLVKHLVEMHDGSIEAKSEGVGKGSEFVVRLPLVVEASIPQEVDQNRNDELKSSLRILVVDDNRDSADSLSMMLKILGNDTRTAYDGEEAVATTEQFRPNVILLDIGLPKLNGYEACRRIREQPGGRAMIIIAQTGWGQEDDRQRTRDAGFDHHLVKPVDPTALMTMLADVSRSIRE